MATTVQKAEKDVRFFEDKGREVSAVKIDGKAYTIHFVLPQSKAVPDVDLVDMSN